MTSETQGVQDLKGIQANLESRALQGTEAWPEPAIVSLYFDFYDFMFSILGPPPRTAPGY